MNINENRIPEMLTVKETAKKFRLPEGLIRAKVKEGAFPAINSGKKYYINAAGFAEYLNTNTLATPAEPSPKSKAKPKEEKVLGISPIRA